VKVVTLENQQEFDAACFCDGNCRCGMTGRDEEHDWVGYAPGETSPLCGGCGDVIGQFPKIALSFSTSSERVFLHHDCAELLQELIRVNCL
jgi:hypothetical protein